MSETELQKHDRLTMKNRIDLRNMTNERNIKYGQIIGPKRSFKVIPMVHTLNRHDRRAQAHKQKALLRGSK